MHINRLSLIAALVFLIAACSTPEERMAEYSSSGDALFDDGAIDKAALEYRNALKLNIDYLPALRGLVRVTAAQGEDRQLMSLLDKIADLDKTDAKARVRLARLFLINRALDSARARIKEALALSPNDPEALAVSAGILLQGRDLKGATLRARDALAIDPSVTDAYSVLAAERIRAGDGRTALSFINDGIAAVSNKADLQRVKIRILAQLGEIDDAAATYDALILSQPDDRQLKREYGYFLLINDRPEDARKRFEALVADDRSDMGAVEDLVRVMSTQDDRAGVEALLNGLIAEDNTRYRARRMLAELHVEQGNVDAARAKLTSIAQDAGDTRSGIEAKSRLADLALAQGERGVAESLLAEVFAVDKDFVSARITQANIARADGKLDEAISALRGVLGDDPASVPALTLLARVHIAAGSAQLASERYAEAFAYSNAAPSITAEYAGFLNTQGSLDLSEQVVGAALTRAPKNGDLWALLAEVRLRKQDWTGAQQAAERLAVLEGGQVAADQILGAALTGQNQNEEGLAAFERAFEANPSASRPLVHLVRAYLDSGRIEEGERFLQKTIETDPQSVIARVLLGQVYSATNRVGEAEGSLLEARLLGPSDALTHQSLYQHYLKTGESDKAKAALAQGLSDMPDNITMQLLKASAQERARDFDGAIETYEGLLKGAPNSLIVINNLASLLTDHRSGTQSHQRAYQLAQRLRDSQRAPFRDTYGWASLRIGQVETAIETLEGVAADDPEMALYHYHLGAAYAADGRKGAARGAYEAALKAIDARGGMDRGRVETALAQVQ